MRSYINTITKSDVLNLMDRHGNDTRDNYDVLRIDNLDRMRLFVHAALPTPTAAGRTSGTRSRVRLDHRVAHLHAAHQASFQRLDRRRHSGRPCGPLADLAKCLN